MYLFTICAFGAEIPAFAGMEFLYCFASDKSHFALLPFCSARRNCFIAL
ncbi:MAG: hypothetical protein ACR2QC_01915 [Gammaproteobacteria bacterium]